MQVSLSSVKGTGPDGSVVKADIEEYLGLHLNTLPILISSFVCTSYLMHGTKEVIRRDLVWEAVHQQSLLVSVWFVKV
jgi:hypothetical protein